MKLLSYAKIVIKDCVKVHRYNMLLSPFYRGGLNNVLVPHMPFSVSRAGLFVWLVWSFRSVMSTLMATLLFSVCSVHECTLC